MSGLTILSRWIDALASLILRMGEGWRIRRAIIVTRQGERFILRRAQSGGAGILADVAGEAPLPAEVSTLLRGGSLMFMLAADRIVQRQLNVPAKARDFLPGIIRNQIDLLSPWPASQVAYGFDAKPNPGDATVLDARVLIASRATIEQECAALAAKGLAVDRVVAPQAEADGAPLVLWSRLADAPEAGRRRLRLWIATGLGACLAASLGLSLWAAVTAASIEDEAEAMDARVRVVQREMRDSRTPQALKALPPAERAWAAKEIFPSAVILIEVLSRALPQDAYLSELHIEATTLRLTGFATDAPSLIGVLEKTGHLRDVHFFAPTTRGPDGRLFKFNIEARIEPRLEIAGGAP
jgi:general secretion pathway protein L